MIRWIQIERRRARGIALALALASIAFPSNAAACDLCAIFTATEMQENRGWRVSLADQFTRYETIREGTREIPNVGNQRFQSWIVQGVVEHQLGARLAIQAAVPYIDRTFRRPTVRGPESGAVQGFGDATIVARALVHTGLSEQGIARVSASAGIKLPTGESDWLGEEVASHDHATKTGSAVSPAHDTASQIHGHDIALGSGSTDFLVGADFFASWRRLFVTAETQYMIRTEGAFDYDYGSDLLWHGGPGIFLITRHTYTLAAQAALSGEVKAADEANGERAAGTAFSSLYVGPALRFTLASSLSVEMATDLPLVQNAAGRQLAADIRFRSGVTWGL